MDKIKKNVESLSSYLLEANADDLKKILREQRDKLTENEVLCILKNKNIDLEIVKTILSHPPFLRSYEVKKALLYLKLTPYTEAIKLLPHMFWMDLMLLSTNMSVHPVIRRSSEKKLIEKMPEMGLGEKIALARRGSHNILMVLSKDKNSKVIEALLQNRFATEDIVLSIASNPSTTQEILGVINYSPKWRNRLSIKKALVLNPNFPPFLSMHIIKSFSKATIEELVSSPYLPFQLKNYCINLLSKRS